MKMTTFQSDIENNVRVENEDRTFMAIPFIRRLSYLIDSCAGTNKRHWQYAMGSIDLICSDGLLHGINVLYFVVGHTMFGPDLVVRS